MRRMALLTALAVLALGGKRVEAGPCIGCKTRCNVTPPPPCCEDSAPPSRCCLVMCSPEHARKLLDQLGGEWCQRLDAVEKLGCRLRADACRDPAVLEALLTALQCDTCWKVRYAAAWSLLRQKILVPEVVLALYLSARLDRHYMVRTRAAEALDILTLDRRPCYKDLYATAAVLVQELRARKYVPGSVNCRVCLGSCFALPSKSGPASAAPTPPTPPEPELEQPEKIRRPTPTTPPTQSPAAFPTVTLLTNNSDR